MLLLESRAARAVSKKIPTQTIEVESKHHNQTSQPNITTSVGLFKELRIDLLSEHVHLEQTAFMKHKETISNNDLHV